MSFAISAPSPLSFSPFNSVNRGKFNLEAHVLLLLLLLQMMIYYSYRRCRSLLMFVSHAIALQSLFVAALFGTLRLPSQLFFFFSFFPYLCHVIGKEDKRKVIKMKNKREREFGEDQSSCVRVFVCSSSAMKVKV